MEVQISLQIRISGSLLFTYILSKPCRKKFSESIVTHPTAKLGGWPMSSSLLIIFGIILNLCLRCRASLNTFRLRNEMYCGIDFVKKRSYNGLVLIL